MISLRSNSWRVSNNFNPYDQDSREEVTSALMTDGVRYVKLYTKGREFRANINPDGKILVHHANKPSFFGKEYSGKSKSYKAELQSSLNICKSRHEFMKKIESEVCFKESDIYETKRREIAFSKVADICKEKIEAMNKKIDTGTTEEADICKIKREKEMLRNAADICKINEEEEGIFLKAVGICKEEIEAINEKSDTGTMQEADICKIKREKEIFIRAADICKEKIEEMNKKSDVGATKENSSKRDIVCQHHSNIVGDFQDSHITIALKVKPGARKEYIKSMHDKIDVAFIEYADYAEKMKINGVSVIKKAIRVDSEKYGVSTVNSDSEARNIFYPILCEEANRASDLISKELKLPMVRDLIDVLQDFHNEIMERFQAEVNKSPKITLLSATSPAQAEVNKSPKITLLRAANKTCR
ncbi:hypothetical protein [Chromobacterium piscinae]|uniref:hypothetical protein n=1 Tax=Chromobacterium piscinae TaxID=686831 RepID=UPI003260BC63